MSEAATVYAQALYGLAKEEGQEAAILRELQVICQCVQEEPRFLQLLSAPNLPKEERCAIVDDSFRGRIAPYLLNFVKILVEKGYIRHLPGCYAAYRAAYNEDHDILPVQAVTAVPLTQSQTARLTEKLQSITGKTIELENRLDPKVLGGVRLDYDGKRVDGTVQNRLDTVSRILKNTVL